MPLNAFQLDSFYHNLHYSLCFICHSTSVTYDAKLSSFILKIKSHTQKSTISWWEHWWCDYSGHHWLCRVCLWHWSVLKAENLHITYKQSQHRNTELHTYGRSFLKKGNGARKHTLVWATRFHVYIDYCNCLHSKRAFTKPMTRYIMQKNARWYCKFSHNQNYMLFYLYSGY